MEKPRHVIYESCPRCKNLNDGTDPHYKKRQKCKLCQGYGTVVRDEYKECPHCKSLLRWGMPIDGAINAKETTQSTGEIG